MLNGKVMIILLAVGLIKKILSYKMIYFPQTHNNKNNSNKPWHIAIC